MMVGAEPVADPVKGRLLADTAEARGFAPAAPEIFCPKGSPQNPMTQQELGDKFMGLATRVIPREQASQIAAAVRSLEDVKDLRDLTDLLVSPSSRTPSSSDM